jgi:hypothetical protein
LEPMMCLVDYQKLRYDAPIMDTKILDQVLLPLGDQFEAGHPNRGYSFEPGDVTEYEKLRECVAELVAERSVHRDAFGLLRLSESGYAKYRARIEALRTLNSAATH